MLYAGGDACQSLNAAHPVPGAPHLSIFAQPSAASLLQGTGWDRDMATPHFPPHSFFGQISPAAKGFLLCIVFFCICPQGGGHDLHISQPAPKISIKTRIIGRSSNGTERERIESKRKYLCAKGNNKKIFCSEEHFVCGLSLVMLFSTPQSCSPALSSTEI